MNYSRKQLEKLGMPFGDSCTRKVSGKIIYGGGGGSSGGTSTTTQNIPEELKPLATQYTQDAIELANTPYQAYTGQGYADLTDPQYAGIDMAVDRALGGSATNDNAESQLNQMISGTSNPYLDDMYSQAAGQVSNSVNSNFSDAGRYGSGAHTASLTKGLGDMATDLYGGAYAQDRANQLQAIGMAPGFANQAYTDASQLMSAGQTLQDQDQNNLDFDYEQFMAEQNDPYQKLAAMSGVFGSNLGGSSTTTSSGGGK
jgi:hypothetical protein